MTYQEFFDKEIAQLSILHSHSGTGSMTPLSLCEEIISKVIDFTDWNQRVVDPCCGKGSFLLAVIKNFLNAGCPVEHLVNNIIHGYDTDPGQLRATRIAIKRVTGLSCPNIQKKDFINEETNMNFDAVIMNPPYKNGLFRKFMKLGLDCLAPEGVMIQVSPDERGTINRKNEATMELMRTNGLVEVLDSAHHFNVGTVTPIVTYIFNKGEPTNTKLLEVEMTAEEALTDSIIKKIAAKKEELGSLTAKTMGTPPRKGDKSEVDMLKAISATGPTYDVAPADTVRHFENADGVYFLNPFFNVSSSTVVKGAGPLYIHKDNIHTVTSDVDYTAADFARLFTSDAIKFMMRFYRGSYWRNKGWIINEIPQIPTDVTDINTYFGFTRDEINHIENNT